jgi:NADPH:quinone reductase-like Zn-dependent oxidoreductase
MKAIKCTKYGPPDVLKLVDIEKPVPQDKEVLVKIIATTVTVADSRVRGFIVPLSFWIPARLTLGLTKPRKQILGEEFSGIIEETGRNVKNFSAGDKVFIYRGHEFGGYQEYICLDENDCIALKPEKLTFEQAAALSFGGVTALYFLREGEIKKDENILILGASGGVGTYAVQIAKYFGAKVTAVCSTGNLELVRGLGADHVIDYTATDLSEIKEKFDLVFDTVGKFNISASIALIKPGGRYIHAVSTPFTAIKIRRALRASKIKFTGGTYKRTTEQIQFIRMLAEEGFIKPIIDRQYKMDEIVAAHAYVDQGHKKGNVIIKIADEN